MKDRSAYLLSQIICSGKWLLITSICIFISTSVEGEDYCVRWGHGPPGKIISEWIGCPWRACFHVLSAVDDSSPDLIPHGVDSLAHLMIVGWLLERMKVIQIYSSAASCTSFRSKHDLWMILCQRCSSKATQSLSLWNASEFGDGTPSSKLFAICIHVFSPLTFFYLFFMWKFSKEYLFLYLLKKNAVPSGKKINPERQSPVYFNGVLFRKTKQDNFMAVSPGGIH